MNNSKIIKFIFGCIFTIACLFIFNTTSNAASFDASISKTSVTVGDTFTVTVKANNAAGMYSVSSSNSNVSVSSGSSSEFLENASATITFKANKAGTATITATIGTVKAQCVVQVNQTYGSVNGNITYYYNRYRGNVPDTDSFVILIPTDGRAMSLASVDDPLTRIMGNSVYYSDYGIYGVKVDGTGQYNLNNIPTGSYKMLIKSNGTTCEDWFTDSDAYYTRIANRLSSYLTYSVAYRFGRAVSYHKYTLRDVTIVKNQTSTLSYDFGITYI